MPAKAAREELPDMLEELRVGTPRAQRARALADTLCWLLRDFLPHDRVCYERAYDTVLTVAFANNLEMITMREEWDALTKELLAEAVVSTHPYKLRLVSKQAAAPLRMPAHGIVLNEHKKG